MALFCPIRHEADWQTGPSAVQQASPVTTSGADTPWFFALLGLGRSGRLLYGALFVLVIPALVLWVVVLPRWRFSEQDERLFRAARHGDSAGVEQSLVAGAHVNAASPVDGKTALFRAAIFGHAGTVRTLLEHGADASAHGNDGQSALDVAEAAREKEKDPALAHDLDTVMTMLRDAEARR
jgi:hypothetical protein